MLEVTPQKAVILKNGKYLALKRSENDEIYPGHWDFPGGRLEAGEDPVKGMERELFEETGLRLAIGKVIFTCDIQEYDRLCHFVLYETSGEVGDITLSEEHSEYQWMTKEELLQDKTEPYIIKFFEKDLL